MTDHPFLKLLLLMAFVAGGGALAFFRHNDESIRRYTVARAPAHDRMLGAVIFHGEQAWFFKLAGSVVAVDPQAASFRALIQSVEFGPAAKAEPTWTLPAGWTNRRGDSMRFATLDVHSGDSELECSVTVLSLTGTDKSEYLLANLNRWREQLSLPRIAVSELATTTEEVPLASGGITATVVDLAGQLATSGKGKAPMTGGRRAPGDLPPKVAGNDEPAPLKYEVPEGWVPGEREISRGGITVRRAAAFEVRDGQQRVEITVTSLAASAILDNMNRWRGQIGLNAVSPEQFDRTKKTLNFAGAPADFVEFSGSQETILGVIAQRAGAAWFVKLQGPTELARREAKHFEEFVASIRME